MSFTFFLFCFTASTETSERRSEKHDAKFKTCALLFVKLLSIAYRNTAY